MKDYNFSEIEKKWQEYWEKNRTFRTADDLSNPHKFYVLDMYPYPSGAGLHVGHPEGYTATDIVARYKRMKGFNVLFPYGLHATGNLAIGVSLKVQRSKEWVEYLKNGGATWAG